MKKKHFFSFSFFLMCLICIFYYSCTKDVAPLPGVNKNLCDSLKVKYSTDIAPIIQAKCSISGCHVPHGLGNGDFTSYAGVSLKADAPLGNGSLRKRIVNGESPPMPANPPYPTTLEIQKIDCWLKNGAPNN
jgi:hypothetical protein